MSDRREERRSALDEFANKMNSPQDPTTLPAVSFGTHQTPQISGAQAVSVYRDEARVLQRIKALAAAAGSEWYYRFPVKNRAKGTTDWIEGPSIKLANDIARMFGNCEVDCRATDYGDTWVFHARFIDLETGYALTRPFQQRKSGGKIGGGDDDRRLDIAFQIGASKAIRNVVVNALQTFADFAFEEAKGALVDRIGKDLENYRRTTAERIGNLVDLARVEAVVGRSVRDWLAPDVARVIAMGKAVSDGMATVDETFPPLGKIEPDKKSNAALDQFVQSTETAGGIGADGVVSPGSGEAHPQAAGSPRADAAEEGGAAAAPPAESFDAETGEVTSDSQLPTDISTNNIRPLDERRMVNAEIQGIAERKAEMKAHAISVVLKMATATSIPPDQRLVNLGEIPDAFGELAELEPQFIENLVKTARSVIKDGLKADKARQYLEAL